MWVSLQSWGLCCFTRDCSCFSRQGGPPFFLLGTLLLAFVLLLPHPPATSPSLCARFYPVAFSLFFLSRVALAAPRPTDCDVNLALLLLLREIRREKALFMCEVDSRSRVTVSAGIAYQLPFWCLPPCATWCLLMLPPPPPSLPCYFLMFFLTSLCDTVA